MLPSYAAGPQCGECIGWRYLRDGVGRILFEADGVTAKSIRCPCHAEDYIKRQSSRLRALDGLTDEERSRSFETFNPRKWQQATYLSLVSAEAGMFTLQGAPGIGKSHLLHCKVNQMRERGVVAIYTTMSDTLDYLRDAFRPGAPEHFADRWELLLSARVLALDELDEFNATPWANERFLRLMDERSRHYRERLTLLAMNGELEALHPKVASRLRQGMIFNIEGVDLRKVIR